MTKDRIYLVRFQNGTNTTIRATEICEPTEPTPENRYPKYRFKNGEELVAEFNPNEIVGWQIIPDDPGI